MNRANACLSSAVRQRKASLMAIMMRLSFAEWLEENTLHEWDEGEFQLEPSLDTEEGQAAADEWDER